MIAAFIFTVITSDKEILKKFGKVVPNTCLPIKGCSTPMKCGMVLRAIVHVHKNTNYEINSGELF